MILLVHGVGRLGGAERSLLEWSAAASAAGAVFSACVPPGALADAFAARGVPVAPIPPLPLHRFRGNPFRLAREVLLLVRAATRVRRAIRRFVPDRIVANGLPAALAAVLAAPAGIAVDWHVRDLAFPRRAAVFAARRCASLVAISCAVEARMRDILPPSLRARVACVPNGIDLDGLLARRPGRAAARRALGLPADAPVVGMLAQDVPWKRRDRFAAMAGLLAPRVPDLHFAVAGPSPDARPASAASPSPSTLPPQFHVFGEVDGALFLDALDILVHPTDREPFGRVLCEAMALGIPVVAVDAAGPAEIVENGVSGILVPASGEVPQALAAAVEGLLADRAKAAALAAAASCRVRERFSIRRFALAVATGAASPVP